MICLDAKAHEIKIDVKKGIEAKNYDEQVTLHFEHCSRTFISYNFYNYNLYFQAKTEKLKPLEVELRRLEDLSDSIVNGKIE